MQVERGGEREVSEEEGKTHLCEPLGSESVASDGPQFDAW